MDRKSLAPVDLRSFDEPDAIFTREKVRLLAAELGISDQQRIDELLDQLTRIALWHESLHEIFASNTDLPSLRKRLGLLRRKAGELLEQIGGLDSQAQDALTRGFRRCRRFGDPRVRHIDSRYVIGASLTIGVVGDVVDLLHEATRCTIELTPSGAGRLGHKALNQAVLDVAMLYEDFSGKKFRREKDRGVWSVGAEWVAKVTTMLTPKGACPPPRSELNTAMRYAARALGTGPRMYVPWLDEPLSDPDDLQKPPT